MYQKDSMIDELQNQELTDERIEYLFINTNFGGKEKTDVGRKGLMVECILKLLAGYKDGFIITNICKEAGLLNEDFKPNKKSFKWVFDQMYVSGSDTILERLNGKSV